MGFNVSSESKLFGEGPFCLRTTSATLPRCHIQGRARNRRDLEGRIGTLLLTTTSLLSDPPCLEPPFLFRSISISYNTGTDNIKTRFSLNQTNQPVQTVFIRQRVSKSFCYRKKHLNIWNGVSQTLDFVQTLFGKGFCHSGFG